MFTTENVVFDQFLLALRLLSWWRKTLIQRKNLSLIKLKREVNQYRFRGRLLTVSPPSSNPDVIRPIIPGDEAEKAPSECPKGDVARDDSQRRFLTQCKVATLFQIAATLFQHCNAVFR